MTTTPQRDLDPAQAGTVQGERAFSRHRPSPLRAGTFLSERHCGHAVTQANVGTAANPVRCTTQADSEGETDCSMRPPVRRAASVDQRIAAPMPPTSQGTAGARR